MASEDSELDDSGYGETSRYAAHLDRGWSLLERADYEAARQSARHAQRLRPDAPDASVLLGAIALAQGDAQESLRWYENAIELDPEYFEPYLAAAQVALFDLGDAERALQLCEDALELDGVSAFDALDLGLLATECQISLGQVEEARNRLTSLATHPLMEAAARGSLPATKSEERQAEDGERGPLAELEEDEDGEPLEDPEREAQLQRLVHLCLRLGRLWLDVQLPEEALPLLRALVERFANNADAWHILSEAEYQHGDPRAACHASLRVYRLDSQLTPPKWLPPPSQIHRKVVQVLAECPDSAVRELSQRRVALVVLVHELPSMELVLEGIDPRVTALALASRGPTEGSAPLLTGIAVYRRNLMRLARTPEHFDEELRFAILEELAAFLQLDDERRLALGLGPLGHTESFEEPGPVEEPEEPAQGSRRRRRKRMLS
ncbi:MAG TPA: tetratricopeptide repeat protein [Nannocystaceae bacterium]|nr:tetratricopeptide repeat protein [Nannocystaceae bacterium]